MAKQAAISCSFVIDGVDLSGDVREVALRRPSGVLDVTAINTAGGIERIHSRIDGEMSVVSFFNKAATREHLTLRAKSSNADRIATFLEGATLGNMAAGIVAKQINYDPNRDADGGLTVAVQCLANGGSGLDYCEQLTAGLVFETAAAEGTGVNSGIVGGTAVGLVAYLQVTTFTGTSITCTIQESSDNAVGDPYAAVVGGAFAAVSVSPGYERIVTSLTLAVEEWLRVVTTGTFSAVTYSVIASRYPFK